LNRLLVPPWYAEANLHFGLEIDVAALHRQMPEPLDGLAPPEEYSPQPPSFEVSLPTLTDSLEIEVIRVEGGREVVAAIEFASPGNKDRPAARAAFAAKCESYLSRGIGLVIVDIVTERRANLHEELMERLAGDRPDTAAGLYAAAYHPVRKDERPVADVWFEPLTLGRPLPVLPLFLRDGPCLRLDLDQTYTLTCEQSRLDQDLKLLAASEQQAPA
jgi:hypothetical protein